MMAVRQRQDAALAEHYIEIEIATQIFVKLKRAIKKRRTLRPELIRTGPLRVATHVAAMQASSLFDR